MIKHLSFLFLFAIACGCSDSATTTSTTSTFDGSKLTGDLVGSVTLTDHRGRNIIDKSGVLVQCEGSSYSTLTDANGNWTLHDLPTRTYSISFSNDGFYTWKNPSYSFTGGGIVHFNYQITGTTAVPLGELPQFTVSIGIITMPKPHWVDSVQKNIYTPGAIYAHTSTDAPDSTLVSMYVIIGRDQNLSIENKSSYFALIKASAQSYLPGNKSIDIEGAIPVASMSGVLPGETVYFKAYPALGTPRQYDVLTDTYDYIGYGVPSSSYPMKMP